MGKKSTKSKQTTTNAPPAWAVPIMQNAANTISNTVTQNQGNLNSIAGGISSKLPGLATQAFGQQPGIQQGLGYVSEALSGKYLNSNPANKQLASIGSGSYLKSNPYTSAIMQQAGEAAGNAVNSAFSMAGRTGGGNNIERLAEGVANAQNQVGFQNYQNERALQQQALGMQSQNYNTALGAQAQAASAIPGLVSAQYAGIPAYLGAAQTAAELPYAGIQNLGQIGGILGNYGTTTSAGKQPGGWGTALLGGLSNMFSFSPIKL